MAVDIGPRIGIEGEAEYRKQINQLITQSKTLSSEMKVVASEFDAEATAQEKAAKKAEVLAKQVDTQKEKVKLLNDQLQKARDKYGENDEKTLKWQQAVNNATAELNNMERELSDTQKAADGYGTEVEDATKGTMEFDAAALALSKQQLAEFWSKAAEGVKKAASAMVGSAKELDKGYDTIIKKTGATGDQLAELQGIANKVYGSMAVDMDDVGAAIGEVNTRFGATGEELEDLSEAFLQFAHINDAEVSTSVDSVDRLMKIFKIDASDTENVLGLLTKAGQDTGISMSTLMNALDSNGATLQELGIDLSSAAQMLANFEANGVDASGVMTALKKAVQNAAKQGKDANEVLADAQERIKNAATETEALQIASDTFGTKGAIVMAQGIRDGRIQLDKATESIEEYGDVVSRTYEATISPWDKTQIAMNNLKTVGSELAQNALSTLVPAIEKVTDIVRSVSEWFQKLSPTAQKVIGVFTALTAGAAMLAPKVMAVVQGISSLKTAATIAKSMNALTAATGAQAAATSGAKLAQDGLNASMWANPFTWLIAGIAAVTAGLAIYAANAEWAGKGMAELNDTMQKSNEAFEEQKTAIKDEQKDTERLVSRLQDLQQKEALSTAEKAEMAAGIRQLNELMPDLNYQIDQESGKIADSTGKVIENTDALKLNFDAALKRYNLAKNEELMNAALDHYNESLNARNEAEEKLTQLKAEQAALDAQNPTAASTARFLELQNAINEANAALDAANTGMTDAEAEYNRLVAAAEELGTAETEVAEAVEATHSSVSSSIPAWNTLSSSQKETAEKVAQAYRDMEAAVTNSIESQMSMFEAYGEVEEIRTEDLINNMQSQVDGVTNWEENLTKLADRGINQGMLQYLLEMGPKGAKYVQAFVNMSDDEFARANKLWEQSVDIKGFTNDVGRELKAGLATVAGDMDDTGLNLGAGLARGMSNAKSLVIAAAKDMARAARDTAKNELGVASPSKVFEWIGEMTGEGFQLGLDKTMPTMDMITSPYNNVEAFSGRGVNAIDPDAIYSAVRSGAENAQTRIVIGTKEFGRLLRGMGVVLA